MGEKIKTVGILNIKSNNYEVEINEPETEGNGFVIHIQGNEFRMDFSEREFYQLAASVMLAKRQLLRIKEGV